MSRTKPFMIGLMLGAGLSFVALRYHVVRYSEGVIMVPRTDQPPVRSAYADIREWGTAMWKQYPEVAAALVADGHGTLVAEVMTGDLLGGIEPVEESLDLLTDERPATQAVPASSSRKHPPTPIRLTPVESDQRIAPDRPDRLSPLNGGAAPRVSAAEKPALRERSAGRVQSALETLFAPYPSQASQSVAAPAEGASTADHRSSIPGSSAAPPIQKLDPNEIKIDLGPAQKVIPVHRPARQASSGGIFSPRQVTEAAKVAAFPSEPVSQPAVSTGMTHQFPLK